MIVNETHFEKTLDSMVSEQVTKAGSSVEVGIVCCSSVERLLWTGGVTEVDDNIGRDI